MSRVEAIREFLAEARPHILNFLRAIVEQNSFVHNRRGVERVAELVKAEMPAEFSHERIPCQRYADHHRYLHIREGKLPMVLAGHLDTLCPPENSLRNLKEEGSKLLGPGVADMKGGLTVLIWALKALERLGELESFSAICIFNSDEEVGSPTSCALFTELRDKASAGLVFEAGGPGDTVVTTRKGVTRYRLHITGKAAHFGTLQGKKISAIHEMAHKVLAIEALNAPDGSLVANVGRVEGGLAANKVPESAAMDFELRYWEPSVGERATARIEELAHTPTVPGCELRLERLSYRPPLQPTPASSRLFRLIQQIASSLGERIIEEKRGGVSDANWLMYAGIPTVDGLGPIGDLDFTEDEYILTESLFQRIELVTHLLLALKEGKERDEPERLHK